MIDSIQVCGTSGEQRKTSGSEEQGQVQNHESKSERRNGLCSGAGTFLIPSLLFKLLHHLFYFLFSMLAALILIATSFGFSEVN